MNGLVTVRFFGVLRLKLERPEMKVEASDVCELLTKIADANGKVTRSDLQKCVIFVNGCNIASRKLFATKLAPDDEVIIFSPVAGG